MNTFPRLRVLTTLVVMILRVGAEEVWTGRDPVGAIDGTVTLPVSQTLRPAGTMTDLPGMRPVGVALSPDGRWLVTSGKTNELVVLDLEAGNALTRIPLPSDEVRPGDAAEKNLHPDKKAQVSYTGLVFSPDGTRLYLSNVNGSVKVFAVGPEGITAAGAWPLPQDAAPRRSEEIPAGLAVAPDGTR
ncbi:MAG: phosphoesterase, partial [Chthoniobacteraceae bacterium]